MSNAVSIPVSVEPRLLDLRKLLKEVLIRSRCLDDLVEGSWIRHSESGENGVDHSVIYEAKDPLAFEVYTQTVCIEKVGAKEWSGHVLKDELVLEIGSLEIQVAGRCSKRHNSRPDGGAEGT